MQAAASKDRRCCRVFCRLFRDELATSNLVFNLVATTSPLNPRAVRLQLFFLTLLTQFALCALYFNLFHIDDATTPQYAFLYVATYAAFVSLLPLFLLALFYRTPDCWISRLKKADNQDILREAYATLRRRFRCKAIFGYLTFVVLSNLLLLYLICFAHVATASASSNWLRSSALCMIIDQLVFELVPALAFAFFAVLLVFCNGCRRVACVIASIEFYRLFKNLVQP